MSPYSLRFSWSPPPEEAQNGVITSYTLTCQPEQLLTNLPVTYSVAGTYDISGFTPATVYNCSVYATTAGGNGPPALQFITTPDDGNCVLSLSGYIIMHLVHFNAVPGPVGELNFTKISATILQISWSEPEVTNGAIQFYNIQVQTITDSVFQASVPGDQKSVLVTSLSKKSA